MTQKNNNFNTYRNIPRVNVIQRKKKIVVKRDLELFGVNLDYIKSFRMEHDREIRCVSTEYAHKFMTHQIVRYLIAFDIIVKPSCPSECS